MKPRNLSIDSFKLVAVFFVIGIHSLPFLLMEDPRLVTLGLVFNQVCRFAVPGFFVVSGYLFAKNFDFERPLHRLSRTAKRLAIMYAFWCIFYVLPYNIALIPVDGLSAPWKFARGLYYLWTRNWENFLFGGSKMHLWFLPALLSAAVISAPFIAMRKTGYLLAVGLVLFAIALLAGPYRETPVGLDLRFFTRNGPFISTIFFASGVYMALAEGKPRARLALGYALAVIGLAWHLAEVFWLKQHFESPVIYDFNSGTLAFGIGAAMLGIYGAGPLQWRWLTENGKYSLGIYLLHVFVMDLLFPLNMMLAHSVVWSLALPLLAMALSLALVKFLMRYALMRRLLS